MDPSPVNWFKVNWLLVVGGDITIPINSIDTPDAGAGEKVRVVPDKS